MGNSSLPNATNQIVLSKIPLTWTASQPGSVSVAGRLPAVLYRLYPSSRLRVRHRVLLAADLQHRIPRSPPRSRRLPATCAQYVHSLLPQVTSCEQFIPLPVYASPLPYHTTTAISGVVSGATSASYHSCHQSGLRQRSSGNLHHRNLQLLHEPGRHRARRLACP